jgi:hypothetical protein
VLNKEIKIKLITGVVEMLNLRKCPQYLKEGRLVLLSKDGLDYAIPENARPITILNLVIKLIARTLLNRIEDDSCMNT